MRIRMVLLTMSVAGAALVLAACGRPSAEGGGNELPFPGGHAAPAGSARVSVVAAENVWGDIAAQIGGDRVAVTSIIRDPSVDPHSYEMSASTAARIAETHLVIENGAGYDDFVGNLLHANPSVTRQVVTVADVVGVTAGDANPHLWYSPDYVAKAATAIEQRLEKANPPSAPTFQANLAAFLASEHRQVGSVIDALRRKYAGTAIAYTERVPGYLVEAAGLRLGTPASFAQAIEDGNDPGPGDTALFELALQKHTVRALLYNAQVTSSITQALRKLAERSHVPVVEVTETMPPDAKNLQTWQGDQATALLKALGG
jgi:zinc/manganese transport system substrate-binding protein